MKTRAIGGNIIEIEEPKAPERPFFEVFAREREALVKAKPDSKLLPPGTGQPGDPR
jgi:hypothetical protein